MDIGLYIHTVCRRFVSMEIHGFYCQYGGCAVCKVCLLYPSEAAGEEEGGWVGGERVDSNMKE